jgi:hypothetical protein
MRIFLAILSGFCLTLIVFAGGAATTVAFLTTEPEHDAAPSLKAEAMPWTGKPVTVKTAANDPEDIGLQAGPEKPDATQQTKPSPTTAQAAELIEPAAASEAVDNMTTAATSPDTTSAEPASLEPEPQPTFQLSAAHLEWCSQHYRSYEPSSNSYTAYSGEQRECVSPYSDGNGMLVEADDAAPQAQSAALVTAAHSEEMPAGVYMDAEHIQSCFERYRSYRPEDNTYQPYGGGPRQQCE